MGHDPPYVIPPASMFKVKGVRQLQDLEQALAKKKLKDPWIRNEAWRYNPQFGTRSTRAIKVFFRGLPIGAAFAVAATVVESLIDLASDDSHH